MPTSPIDELADFERALGGVFFGRFTGGAFGAVRSPPVSAEFAFWVRSRNAAAITSSGWWGSIWERTANRATPILTRVSRESGSRVLREIAARIAEDRARELAVEIARSRVAELVAAVRGDTEAGLEAVLARLDPKGLSAAEIRAELGARLGPTAKQARRIGRWEAAQRASGASRKQILAGARLRARNAAALRARVIASDELTRQANLAREAVLIEAGVPVYSANVGDDRVRVTHRQQTAVTLGDPLPAGQGWASGAPFAGLPPYEVLCRCWVARARE